VAVDVLCQFSLIYSQDGFVKMLSPFRSYFLDSMVVPAQHEEIIRWGPDCHPAKACTFFSSRLPYDHSVMAFEVSRVFAAVPPEPRKQPPRTIKPTTSPSNVNARRNARPKRREHGYLSLFEDFIDCFKELLTFLCLSGGPIDLEEMQTVPANPQSAPPVQQGSSAVVEAYNA